MHEWALAEAVVGYVSQLLKESGKNKVKSLVLRLGALQSVDKEVLEFSLRELFKLYGVEVEELLLLEEEARFKCRRCGHAWSYSELELPEDVREAIHFVPEAVHSYVACPRCGSRDYEVVAGRGVKLEKVEVA